MVEVNLFAIKMCKLKADFYQHPKFVYICLNFSLTVIEKT